MDVNVQNTKIKKFPRNKLGHLMHTIGVTFNGTTKFVAPVRVLTEQEQRDIAKQGRS